jgi:3-hydroxyisobutyrate dehydrogenase
MIFILASHVPRFTGLLQDMGLATGVANQSGSPLPLGEAAENIYAQAIKQQPVLARKDFSAVYRFLQTAAEEGKKVKLT